MKKIRCLSQPSSLVSKGAVALFMVAALFTARAGVIDVWRADDIQLNDSDSVASWSSVSNRVATANLGEQPILKRNATPAGSSAVRFGGTHRLSAASPVGGRTTFSVALVFRAGAAGANNSAHWWGKTGLVDAEEPGIVNDWGTAINEGGQFAGGSGNADVTTYSSGASLVDSNYHVAVFTWGGGSQSVYVDNRAPISAGAPSAARNNAGISLGGIRTGEANRRFNGDFVEIRFYDTALSPTEASNVIAELRDRHIFGTLPRVVSFTGNTNQIYLGGSVNLSWVTTNAVGVTLDNGIGAVANSGSRLVSPTATTTYTLTATNTNGVAQATYSVIVDPGVPTANPFSTNTVRNTPVPIVLRGTDPNGGALTYTVVSQPQFGILSGTPPNVTYTPGLNYEGLDSFTFKVNDGQFDSTPSTVSVKVIPPATAPSSITLSTTNIPTGAGPGSFIAGLRANDVNNPDGDSHVYTLVAGFGDNTKFVIDSGVLRASPQFSGGLGAAFSIRLRATDSAGLFVEQTFNLSVVNVPRSLVINEVHYNGAENTVHDGFIEIHNPGSQAVDISGWKLTSGIDFEFPNHLSIPANGFVVVTQNPATIAAVYGKSAFGPWTGGLNNDGETIRLRDAIGDIIDEVTYQSEFPWPVAANGGGASMQLVNWGLDNDLGSSWRSAAPSPGAINSVNAANAAPNIRQVNHSPDAPRTTNGVIVTAKVTDPEGVASVSLAYQVVAPGQYIPSTLPLTAAQLNSYNTSPITNSLNPAFEAASNWVTVAMSDDGLNGDAVAGDSVYTVVLPPRANRTLVRYRITSTDSLGAARRAPFEDDPSLNFAYFVYDGIPAYQSFSPAVLQTLPVYTLITRDADLNQCTAWFNTADQLPNYVPPNNAANNGRNVFNWEGAFVYQGKVFDHIKYRLRGANGRYHPGKRSFRFKFNDGALFQAHDNNGKAFPTKWREVVTGKGHSNRGTESFALNEVVNFYVFNKVGVPAPETLHFHFRVVRGADENGANQYSGDFWGLNWAQERYDTRFLDNHELPKGNLYKLNDHRIDSAHELRYQGPFGVTNGLDFWNAQTNLNGFKTTEWLLAHANYTNWFRYHAISEAIRNYDFWPSGNKNAVWYFEPNYTAENSYLGRLMVLPYDTTDTWGPTWNAGEDLLFNGIFPSASTGGDSGQNPELQKEYRNVVREIRDLLFQPDEMNRVIDAYAGVISAFQPADHARWLNAPSPASYAALTTTLGGAQQSPGVSGGLGGYVQDMKRFMFTGGSYPWWVDRNTVPAGGWVTRLDQIASADTNVPVRPTITYAGTNGYPVDGLLFQSSAFADPNGAQTFGAMQWRIAEVLPSYVTVTNPSQLKLEWDAAWNSGEIEQFNSFVTIPDYAVEADKVYRVRVRHKDETGRWSQWSSPIEFRPGPRDTVGALRESLVFSEIMYNPPGQGTTSGDEFEYLELRNIGAATLNLSGLGFSTGITFSFTNGTTLAPGATFLLARNGAAITFRYPGVVANGIYSGRLDNGGETLTIAHPTQGEIVSLTYSDRAPWAAAADGFGYSLVLVDPTNQVYGASATRLGNPGQVGGVNGIGGVVLNEILSSSTLPLRDSIELLNTSPTNVNISNWYLTDDPSYPQKYRITNGTILAPGQFAVFTEDQFNPTPGLGLSFGLSSFGDEIYLFSADSTGQVTGYSHGFSFGAAADGVSFGRYVNSIGEEDLVLQVTRTLGAPNSGPRVGPIVLTEIQYHPSGTNAEFVELRNVSSTNVPLYDPAYPTNTWRISGASFVFPSNVWLAPGEFVLLINQDTNQFRSQYGISATTPIFRYVGNLQDSGERLELQAPDSPTTNGVPYYAADVVRYNDRKPWPLAADGAGASLQRIVTGAYGNDPTNWVGAVTSPAVYGTPGTPPVFTMHPVTQTNSTAGSVTLSATVTGTEPMYFQWRHDGSNLTGATNATLVLPNLASASGGTYQLVAWNSAGSVDSSNALLVVRIGPVVTSGPTNTIVRIRPDPIAALTTNATFYVAAQTYNPPLRYQWLSNGVPLLNATNATLVISNVQVESEAAYSAVVSDTVGSVSSTQAMLYPLIAPILRIVPTAMRVATGAVVTLNATATGNPLPMGWEWRRAGIIVSSNGLPERHSFFTFVNTNAVDSTVQYRVTARIFSSTSTTVFNLITVADNDGDGIADEWEAQYGVTNPNFDADGDGVSNRDEYVAGTDPTDAASALTATLNLQGPAPAVSFNAVSNKSYTVQYQDHVSGSPWLRLSDVFAQTNNRVELRLDSAPNTNRFYRVVTPRSE